MHNRIDNARWLIVGCWLLWATLGHAHHGGLGIEGDLVEWALNVDQWQEERLDQGYRIKFLAYPRQPIRGSRTRLVFEIQRIDTGQYVSGLTAQLHIQAPDGPQRTLSLPETPGVTAYYETTTAFAHTGEHTLTFRATDASVSFSGTFRRGVSSNALFGDWATLAGNLTVFAAFAVTWLGLVLAVQQRFGPRYG